MTTKTIELLEARTLEEVEYEKGEVLEVDETTARELIDEEVAKDVELEKEVQRQVRRQTSKHSKGTGKVPAEPMKGNPYGSFGLTRGLGEMASDMYARDVKKARVPRLDKYNQWKSRGQYASGVYQGDMADYGDDTIPDDWLTEIQRLVWEEYQVYNRCMRVPIPGNTLQVPYLYETDRGSESAGGRYGGVYGTWDTAPGYQKNEVRAKINKLTLSLQDISALLPVTDALLEDNAVALGAVLLELMKDGIGYEVEQSIIRGTNFDDSLLNDVATLFVGRDTANQISWNDVTELYSHLLPQSYKNAIWVLSPGALQYLLTLESTSGFPIFMGGNRFPTAAGGVQTTILGLPWIVSEHASALGSEGDIMLADFRKYILAEKNTGLQMSVSEHLHFDYNITTFRAVLRANGEPWMPDAITLEQGNWLLSWAVVLDNATGTGVNTGPT